MTDINQNPYYPGLKMMIVFQGSALFPCSAQSFLNSVFTICLNGQLAAGNPVQRLYHFVYGFREGFAGHFCSSLQ
jgi:hypothetical protein